MLYFKYDTDANEIYFKNKITLNGKRIVQFARFVGNNYAFILDDDTGNYFCKKVLANNEVFIKTREMFVCIVSTCIKSTCSNYSSFVIQSNSIQYWSQSNILKTSGKVSHSNVTWVSAALHILVWLDMFTDLKNEIDEINEEFEGLFKAKCDNMSDYYERKEKRVKPASNKLETNDSD